MPNIFIASKVGGLLERGLIREGSFIEKLQYIYIERFYSFERLDLFHKNTNR